MKRIIAELLIFLLSASLLSGCMLLPTEEEPRSITIEKEDVTSGYYLTLCELKDVELVDKISVSYQQLREGKLSFGASGTVSNVYVDKGDEVVEGQLLAKLDVTDTEKRLFEIENEIEMNELLIAQNNEMVDYYSKKQQAATSITDVQSAVKKIRSLRETIGDLKDKNTLAESERDRLTQVLEGSSIYAPFNGIVSAIKDELNGSDVGKGSQVITVMDASVCAFQSQDLECAVYFKLGDSVEITTGGGKVYGAKVTEINQEAECVTFELDEPDYSLSIGARATINKLLDSRTQVPAVRRVCLYETEEYYYVYVLTENGVREMRKVVPGLIGNDEVEILEGLELNESVVIR